MPLPVEALSMLPTLAEGATAASALPAIGSVAAPIALGGAAAALGTKLLPALTSSTNPWVHKFATNSPLIPFSTNSFAETRTAQHCQFPQLKTTYSLGI